jgi:uncharacterized protein YdhG (YjbR/CyaY superfamily)
MKKNKNKTKQKQRGKKKTVKRIPLTKSHQEITLQIHFSVQHPHMALSPKDWQKKYVKHPNAFVANHSSS